ncbi:hypothetical protein M422DRAFT_65737 [Sphaerobolus stellatus SS14]|nr:hypothetical protein M422DRAFT_65737 [Sphaerobolus stellatus SS14]
MPYISRIPVEILQDIFCKLLPSLLHGLSDPPDVHPPFETDPVEWNEELVSSFTLTYEIDSIRTSLRQVCKYWNSIILHSPRIWCRFEIQADRFIKNPEMLRRILAQSKSAELEIKLQFEKKTKYDGLPFGVRQRRIMEDRNAIHRGNMNNENIQPVDEEIQAVLDIVRSEFHRIRILIIHYTNEEQRRHTTHLFPLHSSTHMPRLQYLFLDLLEPCRENVSYQQNTGLLDAPRLKVCHLHIGNAGFWEAVTPSTAWGLTTLSVPFHSGHISNAVKLLTLCQNLKALTWSISAWYEWVSRGPPPRISVHMNFPFLQSLCLKIASVELPGLELFHDVAYHLHTPQLRSLTVRGSTYTELRWIRPLLANNPQLEELRISCFKLENYTENILMPLVGLRVLILSDMEPSNELLQSIFLSQGGPDSGEALPELSQFVIERPWNSWAVSKTLLKIIKERVSSEDTVPVEFHIWTDEDLFQRDDSTDLSDFPRAKWQLEENYKALLELADEFPTLVHVYEWEHPSGEREHVDLQRMEAFAGG